MKDISTLIEAYKEARRSGKIVYTGSKICAEQEHNFQFDISIYDNKKWKVFESEELKIRSSIASKKYNYGVFICKGTINLWLRVIKIVSAIFIKDGQFLYKNGDGTEWSVQMLKFCVRVVNTFPRDVYSININNDASLIDKLESQLGFIKNTIQPYFTKKNNEGQQNEEIVSKEKLKELWLQKRKKAISIIKNNGILPKNPSVNIPIVRNERYYCDIEKYTVESQFEQNNYFEVNQNVNIENGLLFNKQQIEKIVMECPNGKSGGIDGVSYEDIKSNWYNIGDTVLNMFNISLLNGKVSTYWKHALISRSPKKDYNEADLSTLRDISLLPTVYKVFSKALCEKIMPYLSNRIAFWQRAYLQKRDRQELIFALKTSIDDFKHKSTKYHVAFIDFADAFGSIKHEYIFETLEELGIPHLYLCIIENIYKYSCFQVICSEGLTKTFYIVRGTKTGDPLSGLIFLAVIDRVCRPMVTVALITANLRDEERMNPIPALVYADDLVLSSYELKVINDMFEASARNMESAGLEVKVNKCALMYERRSGNNWFKGKNDIAPVISVQGKNLPVLKRNEAYKYLGKKLSIAGEDIEHIEQFIEEYIILLNQIAICNLPLTLKASALNNLALAKILHHFNNSRINVKQLKKMDKALTETVRNLFGLYSSTTQAIIYLPRDEGGLGIKKVSDIYYTTRLSFIVKMLNHDVIDFRYLTRQSLEIDMCKRGVAKSNTPNNLLGYELNEEGYLNCTTKFGCQSDWMDFSRYCRKLNVKVQFGEDDLVKVLMNDIQQPENNIQKSLQQNIIQKRIQKTRSLSIQGNFLGMIGVNKKLSNTFLYNWNIDDNLMKFCVKARLNIIPTNFNIYIWNREHDPKCPFCRHPTESTAHVLNGCRTFRNFYSARHNRVVDKLFSFTKSLKPTFSVYKDLLFENILPTIDFNNITHRKPDIVAINENYKTCIIIEVTICYDLYFTQAYEQKTAKYETLCECLRTNGYFVKYVVVCLGSLGSVMKNAWSGLRYLKPEKNNLKQVLKWCSISCIIGSNYIWRHRVKKLFNFP